MKDMTATVYDRDTGKVVATRAFRAKPAACPTTVTDRKAELTSSYDDAALRSFLEGFTRGGTKKPPHTRPDRT